MKILLINPPRFHGNTVVREMRCASLATISVFPPVELAYLAGILNKYAEVKILDAHALDYNFSEISEFTKDFKPNVVIFTTSPTTFKEDAEIATIVKTINPKIRTILLDSHIVPVMPEKIKNAFPQIDDLIGQEPLFYIPRLLGFKGVRELENHPLPAYDLLPLKKYFSLSFSRKRPFATLITSTGCPNRCNFCIVGGATVERGYGKKWQFKSAAKIFQEVKYLSELGVKSFYFFDETFTVDRQRVRDLCQMLIKANLKLDWACNGRVDTLDEEVIKIMKKAGCWNIMFGIECGSESLLLEANKGTTLKRAMQITEFCKKNGITVTASFMIGMPEESWKTIDQTLNIAKKINPQRAQFVILTPYPGTKLYEEIKESGLLEKEYDFTGYDAYCVADGPAIRTNSLTSKELLRAQKYIYRKFYLRPSLWLDTVLSLKSFSQFWDLVKFARYLK